MASDCWTDANRIAEMYSKSLKHDFWLLYAAKPHVGIPHAVKAGWYLVSIRPSCAMVGVLVFKWIDAEQRLVVEPDLCLPYDVPLSESELSSSSKDYVPTIEQAAKKSGSILLA